MYGENELLIPNSGRQTVIPENYLTAASAEPGADDYRQIVYLDFDGAETSYHNRDLNMALDTVLVEDSGFSSTDISLIVKVLNEQFGDDVVFTAELPQTGEYSTVYIGPTEAFLPYGSFLGLAETIDVGNQIHDDKAFVFLDSATNAELVVSVIAHETEHIVHGMDHGGEGLQRFASDYDHVVTSGQVVDAMTIGPGLESLLVDNGGVVSSVTIHTSAVMTVNNGGLVKDATVNYNGIAIVSSGGRVDNARANNGNMYVEGVASSVSIDFGTLFVSKGGEVQSVTMVNGGMSNCGTVVSTNLSAGILYVDGGTANTITMYTSRGNGGTLFLYNGGVASSLEVFNGLARVYDGGVAENTTVNAGGSLTVGAGGTATDISWTPFQGKVNVDIGGYATFVNSGYYLGSGNTLSDNGLSISEIGIDSGFSMYVFDNGLVENTTVNANGIMTVCNGGVVENTTVNAGGTLTVGVGGTATDINWTPFQGTVNVHVCGYATFVNSGYYLGYGNSLEDNGESTSEIEVYEGYSLYVFENGLVEHATVYEGGVMTVCNGGVAGVPESNESGGVFIDWGTLNVGAGGEAQFVTLDGGSMAVGGTVVRTSLCAGTMTVCGSANSTTMQAGTLEIMSGGVASSLRVSSNGKVNVLNGGKASTVTLFGSMTVSSGGVALGVAVSGAGVFTVDGGSASNVNAYYDNGIMTVKNGGSAEKMELHSGGTMVVASGGVLYDTMLRGGCSMLVHDAGLASAVSVSGVMDVFNRGVASNNTIAYGTMNVYGSGVVNYTTVGFVSSDNTITSGTMNVYEDGVASNTTMSYGVMNVSSGGTASDTTMSGGTMNIISGGTALNIIQSGGTIKADLLYAEVTGTNSNGAFYISNGEADNFLGELTVHHGQVTGLTVEAGCTMNISEGGTASDTFMEGGTMNIASGGTVSDIEAMGGTVNVAEAGKLEKLDLGGATLNIASGASAREIEVNAGTLNIAAGADIDGVTYNGGVFKISGGVIIKNLNKIAGGTINLYGDAIVDGGMLEGGGYLQALAQNGASGAIIKNYELRGGASDQIIVRAGGNLAENINVYGGSLQIQSGASASNVNVYDGGMIAVPDAGRGGATLENIHIHAGGSGVFAANAARQMNIDGLTMDAYATVILSSANVADFNATGGEITLIGSKNYVSSGGTLTELTVLGNGQLWINDPYNASSGGAAYEQMVNSNLTVEAGATVWLHGTNVQGHNAQIWGNYYVQNGAALSDGVVHDGGYLDMGLRNNFNDNDVCARAVDTVINSGGTMNVNAGIIGGTLSIASGAVVSAYAGATIDFTVAEQEDADVALIDHYDYIIGASDADYTLTVKASQEPGQYALADYAQDFDSSITVKTTGGAILGTITLESSLAGSVESGVAEYRLSRNEDETLLLKVIPYIQCDTTVSLDEALDLAATYDGTIIFSQETDGTTCTFSGSTLDHEQTFLGNGAENTSIMSEDANMVFANGKGIVMQSLSWNGILYGGAHNSDTDGSSLEFQEDCISGNVFGGGRAESGHEVAMGTVSLTMGDCTQAASKAVYGGGYANGGTASLDGVSLVLDNVDGGSNSVYGAGAVNGGGSLAVGTVATVIVGGVHGAVYNGANIYMSGTGSTFTAGALQLDISGGTFTGAVGNGSTPRDGASSEQGASTLNITGGLFQGQVYGGAASFGGNATVASTTVTISGGTFNGNVYGGNVGQTGAKAANAVLTGAVNLTIDCSDAAVCLNGNVFGASMGTGIVGGDVTVTFTGDGDNLHFGDSSFISGDSEYAYDKTSYVNGSKTLVFDGFTGCFEGNFQGPVFDAVTVRNGSTVNVCGGQVNQNLELVSAWNFELSGAEAVMITDDDDANNVKNNFRGDTINLTFADEAESVVAGTDWTVYQGTDATTMGWNRLASVTIGGVAATASKEGSYMAWTTSEYKVYLDDNMDIRLAKLA